MVWIVVALIVIGGIVWTGSMKQGSSQSSNEAIVLNTATSATLGTYLVASNGMALYSYAKDAAGVSNCTEQCATNWPPYIVSLGAALHGAAAVTGAIATLTRTDGTAQVTYKGVPLYFWKNDVKPGDTTGQNVGGVWFVVTP